MRLPTFTLFVLSYFLLFISPGAAGVPESSETVVLNVLSTELERSFPLLQKADVPAYFMGYSVQDQTRVAISATNGGLVSSTKNRYRTLDVQVRVGNYELDNTRKVPGDFFSQFSPFRTPAALPIEDDVDALRLAIWPATNNAYQQAAESYLKVQTSTQVKADAPEETDDFSREEPEVSVGSLVSLDVDPSVWEDKLRRYAAVFPAYAGVHNSNLDFTATAVNDYQVTSEGTRLRYGSTAYYLQAYATSTSEDGIDVYRHASFYWRSSQEAPSDEEVLAEFNRICREVEALRSAPLGEPYGGPAILSGKAAAVFFHEVFGHRVEGHRQKDTGEAQTFAKKISKQVMPEFISVYDDPTQTHAAGQPLAGHYLFDDEGVRAQKVNLVENGVLKHFLLSRSPLKEFPHSNGHGRAQLGLDAVARQGNLIVRAARTVPNQELRQLLLEELKRRGKPYGLIFEDIEGGFTYTGRGQPQVYQVFPIVVYRVYADGRPDELIKSVDFVGTPLLSLEKILVAGDHAEVFNGFCGAESGSVPVSAVSPPLLVAEIEVQKKPTDQEKPPLLPPPGHDPQDSGDQR